MKIAIYTLGCKVNQYETQAMEAELLTRGYELVPFETRADAYIINTCTVTAVSDKKSRQVIRRARKENPDAVIGVCGCYAQTAPEVVKELEVDLISGTAGRMAFLDDLESALEDRRAAHLAGEGPRMTVDDAMRRRTFEVLPAGGLEAASTSAPTASSPTPEAPSAPCPSRRRRSSAGGWGRRATGRWSSPASRSPPGAPSGGTGAGSSTS